jgi:uncharacterized cupredoxin-like copper-binding protein
MSRTVIACVAALLLVGGCASAPAVTFVPAPPVQTPTVGPSASTPPSTSASLTPAPSTFAPTAAPTPSATASPSPTASSLGFTPGTKDSPRPIDIATDDTLVFWPNVITVAEGETVTFNLTATGKAEHEFMVGPEAAVLADEADAEVEGITKSSPQALTFTFDGPGPFAFACHSPGHFEAGMIGYIVVVGPDVPAVGTTDNPRLIEISMDDTLKFMPMEIPVTQGETVRFLLTNAGEVTHEFAVGPKDKVDADEVDGVLVVEADEITVHKLKTIDYTFDGTGPYGFACHEPGHFEAGMKGDIVLQAP